MTALIRKDFEIPSITAGDILRHEIEHRTKIGLSIKKLLSAGLLVSDEIAVGLVMREVNKLNNQVCFILSFSCLFLFFFFFPFFLFYIISRNLHFII